MYNFKDTKQNRGGAEEGRRGKKLAKKEAQEEAGNWPKRRSISCIGNLVEINK
jgi:hypothetical protein